MTGCAIGNHFNYNTVRATIPQASKKSTIAVATIDRREDLLKGSVQNNYVGMTRSGVGIPYRVYTRSGSPLADDISTAVVSSLNASGYQAREINGFLVTDAQGAKGRLLASPAERHVFITINKWESDTLVNTELTTDFNVQIFDNSGKLLAQENYSASKNIGGNFMDPISAARQNVITESTKILSEIFSSPKISNSL
jgi:hypothetical protein